MVCVATYNVRGIGAGEKCAKIMKFLKTKYYNIVCLQETHSTQKVEKVWKSQWDSQVLYSHGTSNSRGCMILIKKGLKTKIHNLGADKEGRYILVDKSVKDYRFCLCNVYAPNADDVDFFRKVIPNEVVLELIRRVSGKLP